MIEMKPEDIKLYGVLTTHCSPDLDGGMKNSIHTMDTLPEAQEFITTARNATYRDLCHDDVVIYRIESNPEGTKATIVYRTTEDRDLTTLRSYVWEIIPIPKENIYTDMDHFTSGIGQLDAILSPEFQSGQLSTILAGLGRRGSRLLRCVSNITNEGI